MILVGWNQRDAAICAPPLTVAKSESGCFQKPIKKEDEKIGTNCRCNQNLKKIAIEPVLEESPPPPLQLRDEFLPKVSGRNLCQIDADSEYHIFDKMFYLARSHSD